MSILETVLSAGIPRPTTTAIVTIYVGVPTCLAGGVPIAGRLPLALSESEISSVVSEQPPHDNSNLRHLDLGIALYSIVL